MKIVGTILVPNVGAFEVMGDRDVEPGQLAAMVSGIAGGKPLCFVGTDYRLRPVGWMATPNERAAFDLAAEAVKPGEVGMMPGGHIVHGRKLPDAPAVVEAARG